MLLPKDFVRLRLTGEYAMDKADGSGTLLFGLAARDWSAEVLQATGLERRLFPATFEGPAVTGRVSAEAAIATGLIAGTPVVAGGGDQSANAVGVGVVEPGVMALSLGTSGVVFAATDQPIHEQNGRVHAFCHALPSRWHMMSVMLSAAGSLRWYRDTLAPGVHTTISSRRRRMWPPAAWIVLPALSDRRTQSLPRSPRPQRVRGPDRGHRRAHMTRAVLEGVAFGLRDGLDLMTRAGMIAQGQVRGSGGGLVSPLWRQILADVLGAEIAITQTSEGAAYGAAVLAAVGAGWHGSVASACSAMIRATPVAAPGPDAGRYDLLHDRYRDLYPALRDWFHA